MTNDFFTGNRQRLREQLPRDSVVILTAFTQVQRGADMAFPFEQDSNFWYLTGVEAPDWRLIIDTHSGDEWLVAPTATSYQSLFDGSLGIEDAMQKSGIKKVLTWNEGAAKIRALTAQRAATYTLGTVPTRVYGFAPNPAPAKLRRQLKDARKIEDIRPILAKLRAIKQPPELAAMQRAIDLTMSGIKELLQKASALHYDYQADAELTRHFQYHGGSHAFAPILSSGKNTCILHYATSGAPYHKNDWLLMDVGAKVDGYCADITRTVPLGATTDRQVAVYEAVRRVNTATMSLLKAGLHVRDYLQKVDDLMAEELRSLGLLTGKPTFAKVRKYFPHAISHGLGIDPHDPLGRPEAFAENMVITVESGIYITEEQFGVRIEDDLLITKDGARNMSASLPISLEPLHKMVY